MWSRHLLVGAVAFVAAAAVAPLHALAQPGVVPCQDSIGVGVVDVPEKRLGDPRARTYVIDHVQPGARFERRIRVCNGTSAPVEVQVYAGAATIERDAFRAVEGRVGNELSGWIRIEPARLTVPANGESLVSASFAVPADAKGGERYAALLVETPSTAGRGGFAVARRVGVRVYLNVGGEKEPASDVVVESLQAVRRDDGRPAVTALVRNTGGRALDLTGELRLTQGPGGLSAGPFSATVGTTLLPDAVAPVDVPLDAAIRGGPWTATITMRSGLLERTASAVVTFPDQAGGQGAQVRAVPLRENPNVLLPLAGGLIGGIGLLLLVTRLP